MKLHKKIGKIIIGLKRNFFDRDNGYTGAFTPKEPNSFRKKGNQKTLDFFGIQEFVLSAYFDPLVCKPF